MILGIGTEPEILLNISLCKKVCELVKKRGRRRSGVHFGGFGEIVRVYPGRGASPLQGAVKLAA